MNLRSLQENVTEATQALDNVAEFIQAKTGDSSVFSTVRPINYGDILNRIDFSGNTSTFAQITVYKTQSKSPSTPVGGTVDLILGVVEAPEGWSFKPSGTKDIWASTAIWYDGTNQSEWSTPFMVTGIDGTPGEPGEQGTPGISYRTIQVYTTTDSIETVPDRPVGGYWNMKTNEVSVPVSNNVRWYLNANDERNPKKFTWIASNTFGENGDPISDWSLPLRITGEDGKNGADGRVIEFIYRLVPNYESFTQLRNFLNIRENNLPSINEPDYVPEVNDNLNIDTVWTDSPVGISVDHQIEVVCSRIRKNVESPWEPWSQCAIWSKWGEDGMDGDGVEYIYLVTPAEINGIPTTSGHVRDTMVPGYDINDSRYQQDEFCFNDEWGFIGYDWTDEPRDVGPGEPMEWVMVRKFRDNKWQPFSEPALWATYSESGVSYITSFVFKRGSIDNPPTRPEGGDYTDPKPSDKTWSDTVPSENSNLPVWMSTRVFCSTLEYSDDDWSEPKMLADTPDFQVEYSADPNVTGDKITPYTGDEASWRASQPFVWGDDSEITDPIWMITSTRHGGKWSDWTLSRIKGEKGDKGDAGTSVNIQHKVKTKQELLNEWADYLAGGAFFTSTAGLVGGEGVYVEEEGLLYIYSGGYYPGEDTNFDLYWTAIHVKGEPGDSAYLYIRFTDGTDSSAILYENTPKKYIGVKYSTEKITDPAILNAYDTYMWSLWKGEDGWGREQVFLLTHKDTLFDPDSKHLDLPSNNDKTVPEYYPTHSYGTSAYPVDKWSDTPLTPTADYPFCWVATRKGQGNLFEDWTGPDGKCALYSRYSYDGADSIRVDLSNDLAIIPMEDGKIDPDFKDEVKTTVRVFVGDEQIPESDFTVAGHGVSIVGDEVKLLLSELTVNTKEIPLTVSLKDSTYQTTINWHILQTDVAYELVPDTFSIRRYVIGEKAGYLEKDNLGVDIWKWSDNKWIASNVPVFAKVTFINGSVTILSTEDGSVDVAKNGHTNINLAGLKDVSEIKIYVVQANASGTYLSNGDILSFETITVVSDGEPGNDGITTFKSTVFKRSNTPITTAPSGGNINSPYPNPLNGWTDGIPAGKEILWASTATFSTDPTLCKDWSVPAQMTDTADIEIIYSSRIFKNSTEALTTIPAGFSKNGADNIDPTWLANAKNNGWSDDGDETSIWMATSKMHDNVWGSWNVSRIKGESAGRTVFVFTISESDATNVGRPTGGSLNISSNVVTGISPTNTAYTWSMNTPSKTETRKYIWQSNATFDGDGNLVGDWSEPICITGAAGRDGADGTNIEFIYRLLPNKESLAALKTALAQKALPNTQTGEVPKSGNDGISSKDWTDEPEGISEDFKVEVMCSRKAKMTDGKFSGWEEWSIPSYWSMWGEEGKDGPGLEYIFCISTQDANVSLMWETLKAYSNYSQYQEDDFYPQKYDASSDWTDEPSDVSKDKPYEYVSTRKKIDGKWEAYSMPKLWAKYAENGASFVTSYVFKRYTPTTSKPVPDTPTGGEWNVAPSGWYDTIPSTGNGPVWMSYRMFKIGDVSYDQTWSTPIIMIDTNDFEVIYGTKEASTETTNMPMPIDIKNREGYAANGWYDEPQTGVDFYWMATATCDNGKWSSWTITKIKGEDGQQGPQGPKGDPGKSVSIKGNFPTETALRTAWDEWCKGNASTSGFVGGNLTTGDGYLIQDTGDLWVYDGDGEAFNDAWVNVGKIQGEPGKSMYITIRYSNNSNGNPMLDEGDYGKYIGIAITDHELTADEKKNYETYKPWQKWSGDDGWGWEQVFVATKTNDAPYINSSDANKSESELITEYSLSDKPIDANDFDCQYIWYWTRKTNGSWKGSSESDNKIYAALYTRWAKDGEQGPVGPQGPQGPQGEAGPQGPQGEPGTFTEEIKQALVDEALDNLKNSGFDVDYIEGLKDELNAALYDGDTSAIAKASAALTRAEEVNSAIETLRGDLFETVDGKQVLKETIFNEQDIYDLSLAALGKAAEELIDENDLAADNVWANQVTALIGKFVKIEGHQIKADTLQASQISGVEELVAEKIEAAEIVSDTVQTAGSGNGNGIITIKDNKIEVSEATSSNTSVVITGDGFEDMSKLPSTMSISFSGINSTSRITFAGTNTGQGLAQSSKLLNNTITLGDAPSYRAEYVEMPAQIYTKNQASNDVYITYAVDICLVPQGQTCPSKTGWAIGRQESFAISPGVTNKESNVRYLSVPIVYAGDETTSIPGNTTYDVYFRVYVEYLPAWHDTAGSNSFQIYLSDPNGNILFIPSGGQKVYLTREGIRAVKDAKNYFEYDYDTGFTMRSQDKAFKFNWEGLQLSKFVTTDGIEKEYTYVADIDTVTNSITFKLKES